MRADGDSCVRSWTALGTCYLPSLFTSSESARVVEMRQEPRTGQSEELHREWLGRGVSKRAPGRQEEDRKLGDLCLCSLGLGQWFQEAGA